MQEYLAGPDGQASRGSEGSQGPLPSRRASVALKETRATLDPLEIQAEWATQDPLVPWGPLDSRG